jgi:hypothetical protein
MTRPSAQDYKEDGDETTKTRIGWHETTGAKQDGKKGPSDNGHVIWA